MAEREQDKPVQKNLRSHLRAPLIVLRTRNDIGRATFFGYARNISRGGMFISSVNPPEKGTQYQLEFRSPADDKPVSCTAQITWTRAFSKRGEYDPGMGIRFLDLPEDVAQRLDDWVRLNSQTQIDPQTNIDS